MQQLCTLPWFYIYLQPKHIFLSRTCILCRVERNKINLILQSVNIKQINIKLLWLTPSFCLKLILSHLSSFRHIDFLSFRHPLLLLVPSVSADLSCPLQYFKNIPQGEQDICQLCCVWLLEKKSSSHFRPACEHCSQFSVYISTLF